MAYGMPFATSSRTGSGIAISVSIEGIDETLGYLNAVEQLEDLKDTLEGSIDKLYDKIKDTAPYKTHYYEEHIRKNYNSALMEGYIETDAEYSKYIIYGGPTLYQTALDANQRGIHWPYSRTVGDLGIIHDIRQIVYEWEAQLDIDLMNVSYTEPRYVAREYTKSGRMLPIRDARGRFTKG